MSKKAKVSFKEGIKISIWALKINWKISKSFTVITFATSIYRSVNSLVNTYLLAKIIDEIIHLVETSNSSIEGILPYIGLMGLVQLLEIITNNLSSYSNRFRNRLSASYLMQMEYEKIFALGVQTNQLPEIANLSKLARDWIFGIKDINRSLVNLVGYAVRVVTSGIIIFSFSPLIGIAILIIAVISYLQSIYYFKKDILWESDDKNTEGRRQTWYLYDTLSSPESMDEVSLVGGFKFFDKKVKDFYNYYNGGYHKILKADTISNFFVDLLNIFVLLGGSIQVFMMAFNRVISIGDTTFYISTINNFYFGVSSLSAEFVQFTDFLIRGKEVYSFFNLEPVVKDGEIKLDRLTTPPSIEIRNITFHYPNSDRNIFKNFSLKIDSGEKMAIVGENGAGKSTLVKLLCRIYDPQEGEILVNGINLKELSINDWYKNVGVLFQDYNFYSNLNVEENIYVGKSVKEMNRNRIIESAKNADAHDFIKQYPKGYKTIMSERFKGGLKPSKGQRQKIAIARFFYRDAPFAIFDEPTSAIDAAAEYRIFNRIYNFFNNKTVMIISHRFSTVRNADRIVVIKNGKVIEEGTHEQLIKNSKIYADNFKKQAEGYH